MILTENNIKALAQQTAQEDTRLGLLVGYKVQYHSVIKETSPTALRVLDGKLLRVRPAGDPNGHHFFVDIAVQTHCCDTYVEVKNLHVEMLDIHDTAISRYFGAALAEFDDVEEIVELLKEDGVNVSRLNDQREEES